MSVVVITGAGGGVGRAVARAFAAPGVKIGLLGRGEAGLSAAAAEVSAAGGEALVLQVDVADAQKVEDAASRVETELGPIDVWVNNAFAGVFGEVTSITADEYRRVTEVTYLGVVYGTKAALDRMRPRRHGVVVQVGSALAHRGIPLQSAYCAAKHAIQGFTESLRCELMHDDSDVHVTIVHLPAMNTPQFDWVLSRLPRRAQPVPPIYQPEVAAEAVVYASKHPYRREYWVGGSTVATIVGNRLASGLLDRYLARTGFKSQQTSEPEDPDRGGNLWEPLDAKSDHGPHGRFDRQAKPRSIQWRLRSALGKLSRSTT